MKHWILLALTTFGSCNGVHLQGESNVLSPQEYDKAIHSDSMAVIIDVRQPSEYEAGHIQGAKLLDVLDATAFDAGLKELDKEKTYYIYCRSGRRSHEAAGKMQAQGLKVVELKGGISAWRCAELPLVK